MTGQPRHVEKTIKKSRLREKLTKKAYYCCAFEKHFIFLQPNCNKEMEQTVFELDLLEEARDFLKSLTKEIRGKIGYNICRVQKGERDNELFKKLDGTEIWEFRT